METEKKLKIWKIILVIFSLITLFFMFSPTSKSCGEFGCIFSLVVMVGLGSYILLPLLGIVSYYSVKSGRLTKQKLGQIAISLIIIILLVSTSLFITIKFNALDESTSYEAASNTDVRSQIYDKLYSNMFITIIMFFAIFIIAGLFFKSSMYRNTLIGSGIMTLVLGILTYADYFSHTYDTFHSIIARAVFFIIFATLILGYTYYSINKK